MGTINYFTSDYITLGVNPDEYRENDDFLDDPDGVLYCDDYINDLYDEVENALNRENFYYFHVAIKPGYYEGFSIDIEFNFGYCLDGWQDRREAQKEITRIKEFLMRCINDFELCAVSPGWCTAYYGYNETLKKLDKAIKEMRETVNRAQTWTQLRRAGEV
jgi:hypothetical protein